MSYIIYGLGNEVLYFGAILFTILVILLLTFPNLNRLAQARYEEHMRILRENFIGRINSHTTAISANDRHMEGINRRAITETSGSELSTLSQSSALLASSQPSNSSSLSDSQSDETCPICLENVQLGVAPLCNHLLCGRCMFSFFELTETNRTRRCPVCRREITMITAKFTRSERQAPADSDLGEFRAALVDRIMEYNGHYLNENLTIWDQIVELPRLINHFIGEVLSSREGMLPLAIRIRYGCLLIVTLMYWLSPYDLFSEALLGVFGFIDDASILVFVVIYINYVYRRLVTRADYFRINRS